MMAAANNLVGMWWWQRRRRISINVFIFLIFSILPTIFVLSATVNTDILSTNSAKTIEAIEQHLFTPKVRADIDKIFQSRLEHGGKVHTFPSYRYTFDGFWRNWKLFMQTGIPTGNGGGNSKFVLFAGDETIRYYNITRNPRNPREAKRLIQIHGYEYGLANMAVFLSQAMVTGIYTDTCQEYNEQSRKNAKGVTIYPLSNSCGQYSSSYQDLVCQQGEKNMECPVLSSMSIGSDPESTGSDTSLQCGPKSLYPSAKKNANDLGREDVEGCCWWGRGPLHTKGVCNLGKLNHYLGAKAFNEGRITRSTPGTYANIDFCARPEAICQEHDEDLLWSIAMFEWAERIQQYNTPEWDYKTQLVEFVNNGMNMFEYYANKVRTDVDNAFVHAVSSIVHRGCHNDGDCSPYPGPVHELVQRRLAFGMVLSALNIPTIRKELVVEQTLDHLKSGKEGIEGSLLMYKRGKGFFPSQRYKFDDFYNAIYRFSKPYDASNTKYLTNVTYFYSSDHDPLYMGDPFMKAGQKYGLANIAIFFAIGWDLSIEKDDTCDELNEHEVAEKLAISNSCGQRGLSYQNMGCPENPDMACKVDPDMFVSAVTSNREIGAAPPLQCGPRTRYPVTGYWDSEENAQSMEVAYANDNGRIDVEGCCWWGRGIIQTKGICSFGKLNYYIGKRAADEGRPSLFPDVNFCKNPGAICGSESTHELIWMSGLFDWIDKVQSYNKDGFNYIKELHIFADGGMKDDQFITKVGSIVQSGCHNPPCEAAGCLEFPCDGAYPVNENNAVTKAFRMFSQLNLWNDFEESLGGTNPPSPAPTICTQENCTEIPTFNPTRLTLKPTFPPAVAITKKPTPSPTSVLDVRRAYFDEISGYLKRRRTPIENTIFVSQSRSGFGKVYSGLYRLDGFINNLQTLILVGVDDMFFYIGQKENGGGSLNLDEGLVNIALFLAHAQTRGITWDTCEELNDHLVNNQLPFSNSCGQHGRSYGDDLCPLAQAARECKVDMSMKIEQVSTGNSFMSPKMFCAPTTTQPFTGYYDPVAKRTVTTVAFANAIGRTDVAGCCFWGRGILLNQGVCDIGRFNYLFGLPAIIGGRSGRYNVDFCEHPEAICSDYTIPVSESNRFPIVVDTSDAKYLIGLAYWIEYVQTFEWGSWNYLNRLKLFVEGGMVDTTFVDDFSEIVLDSTRDAAARKAYFIKALEAIFSEVFTSRPTTMPTNNPTLKPVEVTYNIDGSVNIGSSPTDTTTSIETTATETAPTDNTLTDNTPSVYTPINIGTIGGIDNWVTGTETTDGDTTQVGGAESFDINNVLPVIPGQSPIYPGQPSPGSPINPPGQPVPGSPVGQNPATNPNQQPDGAPTLENPNGGQTRPDDPISIDLSFSAPFPTGGFLPSAYIMDGDNMKNAASYRNGSVLTFLTTSVCYLAMICS